VIWFTADEHYGHQSPTNPQRGIIQYCNRPFRTKDGLPDVNLMDETLIANHNYVVGPDDTVVHVGDFSLIKATKKVREYIRRLNGKRHVFIRGSHDRWLANANEIWEVELPTLVGRCCIVACHYPMGSWAKSHYGSWQVFGHHHGRYPASRLVGKQYDVGVDCNGFTPVSFDQLQVQMMRLPDNWNLLKRDTEGDEEDKDAEGQEEEKLAQDASRESRDPLSHGSLS